MRSIAEWQKEFVSAINAKFPIAWSQEQRLQNMRKEIDDVINALNYEKGEISGSDHRLLSVEERIGGVFADLFMLADTRGTDLEKVLADALAWFKDPSKRPGQA